MISHELLITIIATITLGVAGQLLGEKTRLPAIIYLLGLGILFGPDLIGWINPSLLGKGLYALTFLSVAIILFEGGLTLQIKNVKHVSKSVLYLISVGALITWAGAALLCKFLLDTSWTLAILYGSLVIVTGPTVIGPLLKTVRVKKSIRTILKWEGILIDPVGAIIAVLALAFVVSEEASVANTIMGFGVRMLFGTGIGLLGGFVMSRIQRMRLSESISTLSIFAVVFMIFGVSEIVIPESGIMSVTIAGIVMGNMKVPNISTVKGFKEKLTLLLVAVLFILLAANLRLSELAAIGWSGVMVVLGLIFIVRPLNIFASVREKDIGLKDKIYLSWISPRGIIAAAVASLFSVTLAEHGFENSTLLVSLTFMTIFITVILQGFTAAPVAKLLGVLQQGRTGIIILGGNTFCIALAKELIDNSIPVLLVDSNTLNCHLARQEGIYSECGDVLDDEFWDEMDKSRMNYFLAATSNNELNSLAVQAAKEHIEKENLYQVRNAYRGQTQEFDIKKVAGNQNYDVSVDVLGVSSEIQRGGKKIATHSPETLNEESRILLAINEKGYPVFDTDIEDIPDIVKVVVLE